ncbi:MAG: Double zinc ribbon [Firmicutes bacterium]|nr:Double zinc ribbon [Bacillota bacterium]
MGIIGLLFGAMAGFWVYRDAKRSGQDRNAALAWCLGVVAAATIKLPLLLLALVAYFLVGRKKQLAQRQNDVDVIDVEATVVEETGADCPSCGRKMEETFTVCPYCGCTLPLGSKSAKTK